MLFPPPPSSPPYVIAVFFFIAIILFICRRRKYKHIHLLNRTGKERKGKRDTMPSSPPSSFPATHHPKGDSGKDNAFSYFSPGTSTSRTDVAEACCESIGRTNSVVGTLAVHSSSPAMCPPTGSSSSSSSAPMVPSPSSIGGTSASSSTSKSRIFPSTRFFIALLLCFCYVSIGISTSNISSAIICMVSEDSIPAVAKEMASISGKFEENVQEKVRRRRNGKEEGTDRSNNKTLSDHSADPKSIISSECDHRRARRKSEVHRQSCHELEKLHWSSTEQGLVLAGQNAGSLLMLFTGRQADRLNSKWTIVCALALLVISNAAIPFLAPIHFLLAVSARVLTGISDALLQPSTSSLITRWFPPKERPFAIGLITGGRQIGTIVITPFSGWICEKDILHGWPTIFNLSTIVGLAILFVWLLLSADKPSKHFCTSIQERYFVEQKIAEEKLGKRTEKRAVPWRELAKCKPFYAGVAALICHEYPLVIVLQLLPKYIDDVYHYRYSLNGLLCALPIGILFISKTLSSSLASVLQSRKKGPFAIGRTPLVKLFNGIASLGLGVCVIFVPILNKLDWNRLAFGFICLACAFAGFHTPGVQTALLQIAPAFTGIITGIAFGCVAFASICNKIISSTIITDRSIQNWAIVFWISGFIALLPVVFFTIWGSADRQPWASTGRKRPSSMGKRAESDRRREKGRSAKIHPIVLMGTGSGGAENFGKVPNSKEVETQNGGRKEEKSAEDGSRKMGETEAEAEEGDDDGSAHYEPEEAVASALRLQMFLEDPPAEEQNTEVVEGGDHAPSK